MSAARALAFAIGSLIAIGALPARADLKPLAARVGVSERIGASVPASLVLEDQRGQSRPLSAWLQPDKPTLLALAYYHCPGLCDVSLRELANTLRSSGWKLGADYEALTISIDPHDTPASAAAKRASVLGLMHERADAAWPFMVAAPPVLARLTQDLGYRYDYDAATRQYAHPAVSIVLTPEGKVSRYLYGPTLEVRDVSLALREARLGHGAVSSLVDRTVLSCFQYDPATRRYSVLILGVMRVGAALIALALSVAILVFVRRGRLRRAALHEERPWST